MKPTHVIAITLVTCFTSLATAGEIRFMEGNNCTQNQKGELTDAAGQKINFKKAKGFTNDDARSVSLFNVRTGAIIRVYDDPKGKVSDDWTEIVVKRSVQEICVKSFENTYEDNDVKVTFHRNNGLDGKVSSCRVN